jgi:hypothetical protein
MDGQIAVPGGRDPGEQPTSSKNASLNRRGRSSIARATAGEIVTRLLDRLSGVRPTGTGRWIARCPAHDDHSPSLSIRDIDDRVLAHCFAGCAVGDVLSAVDLTLADLYARPLLGAGPAGGHSRIQSRLFARDALMALDHELTVAVMILSDIVAQGRISETELSRLMQVVARIGAVRDLISPAEVRHVT